MGLTRNIEEIREDSALRAYGAALAFTHVLTFYVWWAETPSLATYLTAPEPICWPFWEGCFAYRTLSTQSVQLLLLGYLLLGLATMAAFAKAKWTTTAWWAFLVLNALKLAIVLQDFQLRQNQHYMAGVASIAFLFVPGKRRALTVLVAAFYFWAGFLKLNRDWLTGAVLYEPLWLIRGAWVPIACAYVVVLEIGLVWGLLARNRILFWATLGQLILFHVMSWPVVGYFYPLLMFCLLSLYPMVRFIPAPSSSVPWSRGAVAFLVLFCAAQLVPHAFPGDTALTGEGRYFGVHMFDALVQCEASAQVKYRDGSVRPKNLHSKSTALRIHCDPIVIWNRAKALCRSPDRGNVFDDFNVHMRSRRNVDTEWVPLLNIENFCAQDVHYRVFAHNEWIGPGP